MPRGTCRVCPFPWTHRGFCQRHYSRARKLFGTGPDLECLTPEQLHQLRGDNVPADPCAPQPPR